MGGGEGGERCVRKTGRPVCVRPSTMAAAQTAASSTGHGTVGLDSGIQASDFKRKKLNVVLVLDVSGSMGSPFDEYYYDQVVWHAAWLQLQVEKHGCCGGEGGSLEHAC